jgi:Mrp family chromosome partitioning ATPase
MDAAGHRPTPAKKSTSANLHGFTSLIDGTRTVEDVVIPPPTPGVTIIPSGLNKGSDQAVDSSAIGKVVADCRGRFAFTVVNGGPWENKHLPPVAQSADAVYLVVRANVTEQQTARQALKHFDRPGVRLRGCIVAGNIAP